MRKLILAAALMVPSIAAASDVTYTRQALEVTVKNVCTYKVDSRQDVAGLHYSGGDLVQLTYKANEDSSSTTMPAYEYRCTANTPFDQKNITAEVHYRGVPGPAITTEVVNFEATPNAQGSNVGDTYKFAIKVTAAAGQFGVIAGAYDGFIDTTIVYN